MFLNIPVITTSQSSYRKIDQQETKTEKFKNIHTLVQSRLCFVAHQQFLQKVLNITTLSPLLCSSSLLPTLAQLFISSQQTSTQFHRTGFWSTMKFEVPHSVPRLKLFLGPQHFWIQTHRGPESAGSINVFLQNVKIQQYIDVLRKQSFGRASFVQ